MTNEKRKLFVELARKSLGLAGDSTSCCDTGSENCCSSEHETADACECSGDAQATEPTPRDGHSRPAMAP